MYQFSGKLKIAAFVLMALGALLTVKSFMDAPKTLEEAKQIIAHQANTHGADGHGNSHEITSSDKTEDDKHHVSDNIDKVVSSEEEHNTIKNEVHANSNKGEETSHKSAVTHTKEVVSNTHNNEKHTTKSSTHAESNHDDHHAEHVFHQLQNRPVAAFYVAMLFFLGITLLVMAFYAAQRVAQAGWSVALFRIFEAITSNLHYVSIFMLIFIIGTAFLHKFHLFPWMKEGVFDPQSPNFDPVVNAKKWWMNVPGWTIRSIIYLAIWNILRFIIRKKSIKQDNGDLKLHKSLFNWSVAFIATFLITESMMSWDWIMGIDPHWFSTLFGWYVLATFIVCALTTVALVTIYLRSKGHLPFVNDSHIHDLAKFMFGFSVFWTYLWFAQFMLIWYADMPEETVYYLQRFNEYKVPFLGMVVLNFVFPVLVLLNSDFKSIPWFVILGGIAILIGHYIDLFVMIMPGTVGGQWGFGLGELGGLLFFAGLFIFATFTSLSRANIIPKGSPFLHESETHHYYNIIHRGEKNDHH